MRAPRIGLLPAFCCIFAAGCASDTPLEYGEDALILPATVLEALPLALAEAQAEAPNAYVTRLGGGFTVLDESGRGANHSFLFHARVGPTTMRRITVHLIHGSPWVDVAPDQDAPPPFEAAELTLDSDAVIERATQLAPQYGIALTSAYGARLSAIPSWPEPENVSDPGSEIAWRVDFLVLRPLHNTSVYFSTARFYFNPTDGELLGPPELPPPNQDSELYPFP